jgi:single-stranded-DNA-specific exonuclease
LIAVDPEFNPGVVGLAASRLQEAYYRPAIVAFQGEETTRGSCRSIREFHITKALDQCADLLIRHGGHAAAAGFTVKNELLPELINRLETIANSQLSTLELRPTLNVDMEIDFIDLKPTLLEQLELIQPTGFGNPPPVFVSRGLRVTRYKPVGSENNHLKFTVTDGRIVYDAIAFRQGHWIENMPREIDIAYSFEMNEFNGRKNLQLNVKDMQDSNRQTTNSSQ